MMAIIISFWLYYGATVEVSILTVHVRKWFKMHIFTVGHYSTTKPEHVYRYATLFSASEVDTYVHRKKEGRGREGG